MNILTFDIEEWYLESILHGGRAYKFSQFDQTLDIVLERLDAHKSRGTFFCLGKMAADYPDVIRKIASCGHEIGCHSDRHTWLTKMTPEALKNDTEDAVHALEDVTGKKVTAYRAPAFSITPQNKWAFGVLEACGIEYDASIFPATRDFGGYPSFPQDTPCRIAIGESVLKEFPVTMMSMLSRKIAFSGGGYFRVLPYGLVKREMSRRDYNICYFHLADLIPEQKKMKSRKEYEDYFMEPGTLKNRLVRYVKSNIGSGDAFGKLCRLLKEFPFTSVSEAAETIAWEKQETVSV